jgi:hypothetical protein
VTQQEDINFLLTNRIPRRWLTLFMGWLSRIEQPLVCELCLALWRLFSTRPERGAQTASRACTNASRASSRTARAASIPIRRAGEPVRRHRRRHGHGRRRLGAAGQGISLSADGPARR